MLNIHYFIKPVLYIYNSPLILSTKRIKLIDYKSYCLYKFEIVAHETLESLYEYFEDLITENEHLSDSDTTFNNGVLTVNFGSPIGMYVINRQLPNEQIWLSSPISGPKRYDYLKSTDTWVYKHNNQSLHQLLQSEISNILRKNVDFFVCKHSGKYCL
ncbi:hypothetical protein PGB90_000629 [Kerria lacca]